ncbi:BZ3500_MvSof-1268-A1-R1_Chr1-1g01226 [Microbotryum saponariae]|uniref:BZ3500_MvSof-1268-A1-R1_Chr1-1g01226 protein n=1 Tax=Microbotryum saponariae TaxID=289078 RepID=A0A2X0K9U7_9BASI|nr:BZ3500_MvSof-1268-A1-R1_Chr1-1g01226 [Microbotryum saponariae]SCZ93721.1 BZ3501_MvSof-1269-A2-R1_Chr1-1g00822 [Microbotryum saponariae]
MDLPTPPSQAHIPASAFPAATPPHAQGAAAMGTPPLSPFESPNVSRPPSPTTAASSTMLFDPYSRSSSKNRLLDHHERSLSRGKDPAYKLQLQKQQRSRASASLLSKLVALLPSSDTANSTGPHTRGRRRSISHEAAGEEIELGNLHVVGAPMTLHSTAASLRSVKTSSATHSAARQGWFTRDRAQLYIAFAMIFMVGSNDSATGANLSSMQEHYGVSYDEISIVFLANVAGYFISCVSSSFLSHKLGARYALVCAAVAWSIGCAILIVRPPFGVFVLSLAMLGFGGGMYDALLTTIISHDENPVLMSWMYSCFGFGAAVSPIVIGTFVDKGISWNLYYYIPTGLSIVFGLLAHIIFQGYEAPLDEAVVPAAAVAAGTEDNAPHPGPSVGEIFHGRATLSATARMRRALSLKVVWVAFLLITLAFGTGDTLSAWMTVYLSTVRAAPEAASRYMLSGLWGGIAIGRVVVPLILSKRLGERTFAIVLLMLAVSMLGIAWGVRNYKIDAVALAFFGCTIGPVTPHVLSVVGARVPPSLKASVMSLTIGAGLVGSGAGPLLFGVIAGRGWLGSLPAVLIVACGTACGSWMLVPKNTRRED